MIDDMGIFRTTIEIAALDTPDQRASVENVMVDTGAEYSWMRSEILARSASLRCVSNGSRPPTAASSSVTSAS